MIKTKKAGIIEVAKLAGVSPMTVTRAFNNSAPVAVKTKEKVMAASKSLDYTPNLLARGLRSGSTKSIGILWPHAGPHSSVNLVRGISLKATEADYVSYVTDSLSDPAFIKKTLSDYVNRKVDGVIVQTNELDIENDSEVKALLAEIPAVVIVSSIPCDLPYDIIVRDRHQAITDIAEHLLSRGRRCPAVICDPSCSLQMKTFKNTFQKFGITLPLESHIKRYKEEGITIGETFVEGLKHSFPDKLPFDSIWCSADEGAAAVMAYLQDKGYKVPEDIAVVGFNNNDMSNYLSPPLASVDRQSREVVDKVWEMLFERLTTPEIEKCFCQIPMKFIQRTSAG